MSAAPKPRPKYYDLSLAHLPPPGLVSIFHRVSGILLFFPILPLLLYLLQSALGSDEGYARMQELFSRPVVKVATFVVLWLYCHHFWAGLRYLLLDMHWQIAKAPARKSATAVLVLGIASTVVLAWRIL